jgi:hypothetical protein
MAEADQKLEQDWRAEVERAEEERLPSPVPGRGSPAAAA